MAGGTAFSAAGHVVDWAAADGKKPGKGIVGGVNITCWPTVFEGDEKVVSIVYRDLKKAAEAGEAVKVIGVVTDSKTGNFKNYTVEDMADPTEDEIAEGDKKSEETKASNSKARGGKGNWQPRDESWQAARWGYSTALDNLGEGIDLSKREVQKQVREQAEWLAMETLGLAGKLKAAQKAPANTAADTAPEQKEIVNF